MTSLMNCQAIEIWYSRRGLADGFASYPTTLVAAISDRLKCLTQESDVKIVVLGKDVLGCSVAEFEGNLIRPAALHDFMLVFTKWLYTGSLESARLHYADLWYFGKLIGAPRLQNDALKLLAQNPSQVTPDISIADLQLVQFRGDDMRLKYTIDVYVGRCVAHGDSRPGECRTCRIISAKHDLSEIFKEAIRARTKGEIQGNPWNQENSTAYLLDENLTLGIRGYNETQNQASPELRLNDNKDVINEADEVEEVLPSQRHANPRAVQRRKRRKLTGSVVYLDNSSDEDYVYESE